MGISRKTVKKYIEDYEQCLSSSKDKEQAHSQYLLETPVYKGNKRSKLKLTIELQNKLDELIKLNEEKRLSGLRKQILKKSDIWSELVSQGYDIGYTTVCNYIRKKENKQMCKEAFIRQVFEPGKECEFDWGEVKLKIKGRLTTFQLAVFTSTYANYRFAYLYNRQNTTCFMDSHVQFFRFIGGAYHQMTYDNMRVAVANFTGKNGEKEPTRALLELRAYYGFTHRFCNAYKGNEKGHVERSVEYIRRKAFALKDDFNDFSQAQEWLSNSIVKINSTKQKTTGKSADELFQDEKRHLNQLPLTDPQCSERVQLRVDKYSTVTYKQNRYSAPDHLVGEFIDADILSHDIHLIKDNKIVAVHALSFEKHSWTINIDHYLVTFKKKPGALPSSYALASNKILKSLYHNYFQDAPREFIELIDYCRKNEISDDKLQSSVTKLLNIGNVELNIERLKVFLGNKQETILLDNLKENKITDMSKTQLEELALLMYSQN